MPITPTTTLQLMSVFKSMMAEDSDQQACFIIGAGASRDSGIPTGGDLALRWWNELKDNQIYSQGDIENWLAEDEPESIQIKKRDLLRLWRTKPKLETSDLGPYYSRIYQYRFAFNPDEGYEALSKAMTGIQPSYGYSVLAKALCMKQHNVVITTNFDNLLEFSLHIYTDSHPLMCGHEALASFAKHSNNRPLIAKIHRDLFLKPLSHENDLKRLKEAWEDPLKNLLADRKVFVIGYGGNDGGLMGLLKDIPLKEKIYWCDYKKEPLQPHIMELLEKQDAYLVETDGFDELMFLLRKTLDIPRIDNEILNVAKVRADNYRIKEEDILTKSKKSKKPEVQAAAKDRLNEAQTANDSWSYYLQSLKIMDVNEKVEFLQNGIKLFEEKDCVPIYSSLAYLLQSELKSKDPIIEEYYQKVLKYAPYHAATIYNYAVYLQTIRHEIDKAQEYYEKALELEPENGIFNGGYASLIIENKNYNTNSENYFKKALKDDPVNGTNYTRFAIFLNEFKSDNKSAEEYFKIAVNMDPENAYSHLNYAIFLDEKKMDTTDAEMHYLKALGIDPKNSYLNFRYGDFLLNKKLDYVKAEDHYKTGLASDPENVGYNNNLIITLIEQSFNVDGAKRIEILQRANQIALKIYDQDKPLVAYNLACINALLGYKSKALAFLEENLQGPTKMTLDHILKDKEWKTLLNDAEFKALMSKYFSEEHKS
jgi:protein O-mannosyl-transferase